MRGGIREIDVACVIGQQSVPKPGPVSGMPSGSPGLPHKALAAAGLGEGEGDMFGGSGGWLGENPATTSGVPVSPRSRNEYISMSSPSSAGNSVKIGIDRQNGGVDISRVAIIIRISRDHVPGRVRCGVGGGLFESDAQCVVGGIVGNRDP